MMVENRKSPVIPQVIAIIMLLWALNPENPYGYYVLLRVVISAVFAYLAFKAHDKKNDTWVWILGITAFVYNPVIPIHLNRDLWSLINLITITIAVVSIIIFKRKSK